MYARDTYIYVDIKKCGQGIARRSQVEVGGWVGGVGEQEMIRMAIRGRIYKITPRTRRYILTIFEEAFEEKGQGGSNGGAGAREIVFILR